jgi:hypothetical protein
MPVKPAFHSREGVLGAKDHAKVQVTELRPSGKAKCLVTRFRRIALYSKMKVASQRRCK